MAAVEHVLLSTEQYKRLTKRLLDNDSEQRETINHNWDNDTLQNNRHPADINSSSNPGPFNGNTVDTKKPSEKLSGEEITPSLGNQSKDMASKPAPDQASNPASFNQATASTQSDRMGTKEPPEKLVKERRKKKTIPRTKKKRSGAGKHETRGTPYTPAPPGGNNLNKPAEFFTESLLPPGERSSTSFKKEKKKQLPQLSQKWASL